MRALEKAYLRALIDPGYAAALTRPEAAAAAGLSADELALLVGFAPDTLRVERAGRQRHLWERARSELPRTLARTERRLSPETIAQLRERLFTDLLWHPERTLDLPRFGRGYEIATHLRDGLVELARTAPADEELELIARLAELERAVFGLREGSILGDEELVLTIEARHDLRAAAERPDEPAASFREPEPVCWYLTRDGGVGRVPLAGREP